MEELLAHARSVLSEREAGESRGSSSSRLEGEVKLTLFFQLFWKDRFANRPRDLHEMYLLVRCSDLLQQGRINEVADALAGRIMAEGAVWELEYRKVFGSGNDGLRQPGAAGNAPCCTIACPPCGKIRTGLDILGRKRQRIRRSRKLDHPLQGERKRKRQEGEELVEDFGQGEGDGESKARLQGQEVRASPCQAAAAPLSVGCGCMPGSLRVAWAGPTCQLMRELARPGRVRSFGTLGVWLAWGFLNDAFCVLGEFLEPLLGAVLRSGRQSTDRFCPCKLALAVKSRGVTFLLTLGLCRMLGAFV